MAILRLCDIYFEFTWNCLRWFRQSISHSSGIVGIDADCGAVGSGLEFRNLGGRTGKFYDPVRSLLKSKNQEINRLQLAVKLPWAIFFESVDIPS
ncbi:hypothetical protein TNCV_4809301 [Trichonephila clavipes]|nr:hypothetical protein TNCV_4809301 [Trichonephila clavipes]